MSANVMRARQRLEGLIEAIESECPTDEGYCHDHDLTDDGECALASDLRAIYAELGGAS